VKQILRNSVYAGCNVYGRHESGDTRVKPREEWTVVPGMQQPVIEPEVAEWVQEIVREKRPRWIRLTR